MGQERSEPSSASVPWLDREKIIRWSIFCVTTSHRKVSNMKKYVSNMSQISPEILERCIFHAIKCDQTSSNEAPWNTVSASFWRMSMDGQGRCFRILRVQFNPLDGLVAESKNEATQNIHIIDYLVGGWATPLKNMSSSIGMMRFPTEWENKKWQPNHQPDYHCNSKWHMVKWSLFYLSGCSSSGYLVYREWSLGQQLASEPSSVLPVWNIKHGLS